MTSKLPNCHKRQFNQCVLPTVVYVWVRHMDTNNQNDIETADNSVKYGNCVDNNTEKREEDIMDQGSNRSEGCNHACKIGKMEMGWTFRPQTGQNIYWNEDKHIHF